MCAESKCAKIHWINPFQLIISISLSVVLILFLSSASQSWPGARISPEMDTSLKTAAPLIRPVDVKDLGITGISDPTLTQAVDPDLCIQPLISSVPA